MAGIRLASEIFLVLDARVALVSLLLLIMAAAAPIVLGWLALLPSEREPFALAGEASGKKPRDPFAIFLLVNISVSLLLRIPGLQSSAIVSRLGKLVSAEWADHAVMIGYIWLGFVPGLAAAYAAVRPNPLRLQLLIGGTLTLLLWFMGTWLVREIAGVA